MKKHFLTIVAILCVMLMAVPSASAKKKRDPLAPKRIVFVPHDNRPISNKQTAEVIEKLGYELVVPPDELLGNRTNLGNPEKLWNWLETNAVDTEAAVISADSMLYGSLVGSRNHTYSQKKVLERAARFKVLRALYPETKLYVFSSIMRTPKSGEASGHMEPDYYGAYGADIFRYTSLKDKEEVEGLTPREKKECAFLKRLIPEKDLSDWLGRRDKNFAANKYLIELDRSKVLNYLVLGRDDNAPYSQTHMEGRHLTEYSKGLDGSCYQNIAGIDEIAMLLLARAVNRMTGQQPSVYVRYNWGRGPHTVPAYSDERISESIDGAIEVSGGIQAFEPETADLVLAVNTNPNGQTFEANDRANDGSRREGTDYFADIVSDYVKKGYPVGIADVAYANGADNTLMENLKKRDLLFKIHAYAGWNTPTNSSGFVIAEGMLGKQMSEAARIDLLLTRYLDDWAYQANIRNTVARQLTWLRGDGLYGSLNTKIEPVSARSTRFLERFIATNFPPLKSLEYVEVSFPWNRMFESDIYHIYIGNEPLLKLQD